MKIVFSKPFNLCLWFIWLLSSISCTHYIDKARTVLTYPIDEGRMQFYPDSNVFIFRSHITFRADTEIWPAKSFQTKFPKGIIWYDLNYGNWFIFYYKSNQTIAIWINIEKYPNLPDSTYTPNSSELSEYIERHFSGRPKKLNHNIEFIPYMKDRKQLLIKKKDVQILFYNIKKENFISFQKDLATFKFL